MYSVEYDVLSSLVAFLKYLLTMIDLSLRYKWNYSHVFSTWTTVGSSLDSDKVQDVPMVIE